MRQSGRLGTNVWWLVHALGSKSNPRWSDRVVAALTIALLGAALLAVPVAATWGSVSYEQELRSAALAASTRHQVTAVVATDPEIRFVGADPRTQTTEVWAGVRWTGADGATRAASVEVATGSVVGSTVAIWVDTADRVTTAPPTESQVVTFAVMSAVAVMLALQAFCVGMISATRLIADARARRAWQREWETVEPRWTRQEH